MQIQSFNKLSNEEKVNFLAFGQELLIKYHPTSDYVIRRSNVNQRLDQLIELATVYKGLCYADDNICVLFNRINISEATDAVKILRENKFREPHANPNAISIDFVVFRKMQDCIEFCKQEYNPSIKHVVYSHSGKPQIFDALKLIGRTFKIPVGKP